MTGSTAGSAHTTQELLALSSDLVHAQLGTFRDLIADGLYLRLIERAEAFNGGSPFTLCRCPALGSGDINLSGKVRGDLAAGTWIPETGTVELSASAPANGAIFAIRLRIPRDSGHLAEVHYDLGPEHFESGRREATVKFLVHTADDLGASFGYAHHARDEIVADTVDPNRFRALTGKRPPLERGELGKQPGRSSRAGQYLIACRWLSLFGVGLTELIGTTRLGSVPCEWQHTGNVYALRLYDDPLAFESTAARTMQARVREHLRLDELAETASWQMVERRPSADHDAYTPSIPVPNATMEVGLSVHAPLFYWASLYDADPRGLPGEEAFYTAQARQAAGRVLEIGSATGRLTIPLARTGVPVVALERSHESLESLRHRLASEDAALQRRTSVVAGDIDAAAALDGHPFAAAFIPFRGINRLAHGSSPRELFEKVRALLAPGGVLVFNTFFPEQGGALQHGKPVPRLQYNGVDPATGLQFLIYDTVEEDPVGQRLSVMRRVVEISDEGSVVSDRFVNVKLRYFYPDELRYLLELAGFRPAIYGGFASEPLIRPDQEVVVVASRS